MPVRHDIIQPTLWLAASCAIALACTMAQATSQDRPPVCEAIAADPRATRNSWPVERRIAETKAWHAQWRSRFGQPMPVGRPTIWIMLTSSHHSTTQISYVATRTKGRWSVSRMAATIDGPAAVEPVVESAVNQVMSADDGRALDALLDDACLYRQPSIAEQRPPRHPGEWSTSLAVSDGKRAYEGSGHGPLPSAAGKIVSKITGW